MARGLCLALALPACASATEIDYLGTFVWPHAVHQAGGFSGLDLSEDGVAFTAISDRGTITSGRLIRDGGRIIGIDAPPPHPLLDPSGQALPREQADSEGLALAPDGTLYVSFEGRHRVWAYTGDTARPLPAMNGFTTPHPNAGPEALAIDPQGRLLTMPERSGGLTTPFPVWRFDGQWTQPFTIPRRGGFLPVGADFGPDGRLYLLERSFSGFAFSSRVRAFTLSEDDIVSAVTVLETAPGQFDNLEGLSVWRDASGAIRLTMISDDNFNALLQSTQIVEYRLR